MEDTWMLRQRRHVRAGSVYIPEEVGYLASEARYPDKRSIKQGMQTVSLGVPTSSTRHRGNYLAPGYYVG